MDNLIISVSQLNFYIKSLLDGSEALQNVFIKGEISNLTDHYRSGHIYLSLKDEKSVVKCIMFASYANRLVFKPENGMSIIARGKISLYEATGQYQLYIEDMQPDGIGALSIAYEQLKQKLAAEGLFDQSHKKQIPKYPKIIGVITSPTGAARRDIEQILKRRYPIAEILFYPVLVQGDSAALQLVTAVNYFNKNNLSDVIIIGRGGGSIEDLWAFNNEQLARAIYSSNIPIISAVGHETDFTISDFVADIRAATPSAAAELATPNSEELFSEILDTKYTLKVLINKRLQHERQLQSIYSKEKIFYRFSEFISKQSLFLDDINKSLLYTFKNRCDKENNNIINITEKLQALNPLSILNRGYGIITLDNKIINSISAVTVGNQVCIRLPDGSLNCTVDEIKEDENE